MSTDNRNRLDMPQPLQCDQCGALATVHSNQYVYNPRIVDGKDVERVLVSVISLVECPKCGVRSQTTDLSSDRL